MTFIAASALAAVALCSDISSAGGVDGAVYTPNAGGPTGYYSAPSNSQTGPNAIVSDTFNDAVAKGSYGAKVVMNGALPHISLNANSGTVASNPTEVDASYFAPRYITVSGISGAAPTALDVHWNVSGMAKGSAGVLYYGSQTSWDLNTGANPFSAFNPDLSTTTDPSTGTRTFSGTAVERFTLGAANAGVASAEWVGWIQAYTNVGEAALDMLATAITFPEFGDKTAEQLGWTIGFSGTAAPSPPPGPGGGGPTPTPEPTACLIWAAAGAVVALRSRGRFHIAAV